MQNLDIDRMRLGNRLAAGKEPFRIKFGMTGDFSNPQNVLSVLKVL